MSKSVDSQMRSISVCNACHRWSIEGEKHECPLEGVRYVGYAIIDGKSYINLVSKDGFEWESVGLIPMRANRFSTTDSNNGRFNNTNIMVITSFLVTF
jgi:hypothetical protein